MFARVEKPRQRRTGKEYKDSDEEPRRIILTDAEDVPLVEVAHEKPQQRSLKEFGKEEANSLVRLISKLIKHFPVAITIVLIGVSIHVILERWLGRS
jgi:hypothetical protein